MPAIFVAVTHKTYPEQMQLGERLVFGGGDA
jgi:hypothetical protein